MSLMRNALALALAAALCCPLAGCAKGPEAVQTTIFAMDTVMNLTIYGTQDAMEAATETIYTLDGQLSVTSEDSFVYALNHAGEEGASVPDGETLELLIDALRLCDQTGGALDITAYPAVKAWGFTTGEYRIPDQAELDDLAAHIDYTAVEVCPNSGDFRAGLLRLPEGMELDLGAVAKGYTGDRLSALLREAGVTSALLDLGQSSIQAVGGKPDGSPWRIGIQDPAGDGCLGVLELADQAMGTSGGYQRYFEQDGVRYWHIIDPDTAAPARSGLASVTVVGPSGLVCDGLSTALFVMGLEDSVDFWRGHPELDFEAIFISDDGSIAITAGLEDSFSLAEGCTQQEVTVLS